MRLPLAAWFGARRHTGEHGGDKRNSRSAFALVVVATLLALGGCATQKGPWRTLGPDDSSQVENVVVDPHLPKLIYSGTDAGTVYLARADNGSGAVPSAGIPRGAAVASLLPDPAKAGVVFAGTSNGLYRSDHYAEKWLAYGAGLPNATAMALAGTPDDATLLAGLDHGDIYRSGDDGAHWSASGNGLPARATPVALLWDAHDARWLAGLHDVSGATLYASSDGTTWSPVGSGLPSNAPVNALAQASTSAGATIFAGTNAGLFASADGGANWKRVAGGLPQGSALALATYAPKPGWVYVGLGNRVYQSTDSGATWSAAPAGLTSGARGLAIGEGPGGAPVIFVAAGSLLRYPGGETGSNFPVGLALAIFVLGLLVAGYVLFLRMRRFSLAMGAQRTDLNTGRAADAARRWVGGPREPSTGGTGAGASSLSRTQRTFGSTPQESERRGDASQGQSRKVITPESGLTTRAETGAPASEQKAKQNGHGKPPKA